MNAFTQNCRSCQQPFTVSEEERAFLEEMGVPVPQLCPQDRQFRRIQFRNFHSLYKRKSDMSGKTIISMYPDDAPYTVYEAEEWWGDSWDPLDYGREFDFSRPFFEQFGELLLAVPKVALFQYRCENSSYANVAMDARDCYLVGGCVDNEKCLYGHIVWKSYQCVDGLYLYECQWCYECVDCVNCYATHFSSECTNSSELYFCFNMQNCQNCFGCVGLRNKQWCWFNEQVSEAEYKRRLAEVTPLTPDVVTAMQAKLDALKLQVPHPAMFSTNNEDVSGNHLYFSKNLQHCFDAKRCEDCRYLYTSQGFRKAQDISFSPGTGEYLYNTVAVGGVANQVLNSHMIIDCHNVAYSDYCFNSHDIFGCAGLKRHEYCILNKRYSKEEYEALRERIVEHMKSTGEWGEFFPVELSPFAYNETIAYEYYPESRESVLSKGLRWREADEGSRYVGPHVKVPERIDEVSGDVVKQLLTCERSGELFKVTPQEFEFYKRMGLPVPRRSPKQRQLERMARRNPRWLWERVCEACGVDIQTSYSPDRPERVHCQACYLKGLY